MNDSLVTKSQQLIEDIVAAETKVFRVSQLLPRFQVVAERERTDQVITQITNILEKRSAKDSEAAISTTDLQGWYNELIGLNYNSKFASIFADLLPYKIDHTRYDTNDIRIEHTDVVRDLQSQDTVVQSDANVDAVKGITGALLDDATTLHLNFGTDIIENSQKIVEAELESLGIQNIRTSIKCGNQYYVLCTASFSSDGVQIDASIPIEVVAKQALLPSVLVANQKTYTFDRKGLSQVIQDKNVIHSLKENRQLQDIRVDEGRSDQWRSLSQSAEADVHVDEYDLMVHTQVHMPPELMDVEDLLTNAVLQKESRYNQSIMNTSRDFISNELKSLGLAEHKIHFVGDYKNGLVFGASILNGNQKLHVRVPIEVSQDCVLMPAVFISKNAALEDPQTQFYSFNGEGFHKFAGDESSMIDEIRYSGELLTMPYNELQKVIHAAVFKNEHHIAREALNVVRDKFGIDAHTTALNNYQGWIEESSTNYQNRCGSCDFYIPRGGKKVNGKIITASVHNKDHCSLLNIACHKVVQNAGICTKSSVQFDKLHDDCYQGEIVTNQIKMT